MGKIGFACKWIDTPEQVNGIGPKDSAKQYNLMGTTVAWLKRQTQDVAEAKMWEIVKHNIEATRKLVTKVGELDEHLRMVRIGSDMLPMYTEPTYGYFCQQRDVQDYMARHLAEVGQIARDRGVRLSMHPGQFVVLASENDNIVERSIEEFEYHVDIARCMGYGATFQDFKINVHIAGKAGPEGIRRAYKKLSPEARNCITIENEENSWGLNDCLSISDIIPIVLDIHHHWIREGEYLDPSDARVARVLDSWRGLRPTLHYSLSREDVLVEHTKTVLPNMANLLTEGYKKQKMRAHSDFYWNSAANRWAAEFNKQFDIMCEAKGKNLASFAFAQSMRQMQA